MNTQRLVDRFVFLTSNIAMLEEELETVREALIAAGEGAHVGTKDAVTVTARDTFKKALAERLLTEDERRAASELTVTAKAARASLPPEKYQACTEKVYVVKGVTIDD